jgi:hypothetical protein
MTDEELDLARGLEGLRIYADNFAMQRPTKGASVIAARLAREGWMPGDSDLDAARWVVARVWAEKDDRRNGVENLLAGLVDDCDDVVFALAGIKRGRELMRDGQ